MNTKETEPLVLVKLDTHWADETDPQGFEIMTQSRWEEYLVGLDKMDWPLEQYYGTNEYYDIHSKEEFLTGVTAHPITEEEADIFRRLFGKKYNGDAAFGFTIPDIFGIIEDQEFDASYV